MKFLFDYLPILAFFISYKIKGVYFATAVTMLISFVQVCAHRLICKRFEKIHVITLVFIVLLGGLTLLSHDIIFMKWKPTVIYWLFSLMLIGSQLIGKKTLIHRMLDEKLTLPAKAWVKINFAWALFFIFLGALNLYVIYHFSTNAWVNFKLFGTLGITIMFVICQALYISRYLQAASKAHSNPKNPTE